MRLTKDFHERLQAEALSKIDVSIRKGIREFSKLMSKDKTYYFTPEELVELQKVSKYPKWLSGSSTLRINESFLPKEFREWYDKCNDRSGWFKYWQTNYIEVEIEYVYLPDRLSNARCLYPVDALLKPTFQKLIRRDHLKKELEVASKSCTTPKKLKQILVGIEKLAPKVIKEMEENPLSAQLPVVSYDLNKYMDLASGPN